MRTSPTKFKKYLHIWNTQTTMCTRQKVCAEILSWMGSQSTPEFRLTSMNFSIPWWINFREISWRLERRTLSTMFSEDSTRTWSSGKNAPTKAKESNIFSQWDWKFWIKNHFNTLSSSLSKDKSWKETMLISARNVTRRLKPWNESASRPSPIFSFLPSKDFSSISIKWRNSSWTPTANSLNNSICSPSCGKRWKTNKSYQAKSINIDWRE